VRSRRLPTTWPGTVSDRIRFEGGARRIYPSLRGRPWQGAGPGGFRYTVVTAVPFYEARRVTMLFRPRSRVPTVLVDGPSGSPHRYGDTGALCLWFPNDPSARRWRFTDGLCDLLDLVVTHLFKEAWWREFSEWLGEAAPHDPPQEGRADGVAA